MIFIELIGPPSTKSTFDNDIYIYIERKTSSSKINKTWQKKTYLKNNVLVLEVDSPLVFCLSKTILWYKSDMNKINFDTNQITGINYSKKSFIFTVF